MKSNTTGKESSRSKKSTKSKRIYINWKSEDFKMNLTVTEKDKPK